MVIRYGAPDNITRVKEREATGDTCTFALPDYRVGMLNLTRQEQTVMILILIALLVGAGIRQVRVTGMLPDRTVPSPSSNH
jgi:hypothetical protein